MRKTFTINAICDTICEFTNNSQISINCEYFAQIGRSWCDSFLFVNYLRKWVEVDMTASYLWLICENLSKLTLTRAYLWIICENELKLIRPVLICELSVNVLIGALQNSFIGANLYMIGKNYLYTLPYYVHTRRTYTNISIWEFIYTCLYTVMTRTESGAVPLS